MSEQCPLDAFSLKENIPVACRIQCSEVWQTAIEESKYVQAEIQSDIGDVACHHFRKEIISAGLEPGPNSQERIFSAIKCCASCEHAEAEISVTFSCPFAPPSKGGLRLVTGAKEAL
jgi:hypothetical protein